MAGTGEVTALLERWNAGDTSAMERIAPLLYHELRRLAAGQMNQQGAGHTLQPTALVHEAYLKLAANSQLTFPNRASFLALMARAMRQILVDHARARQSGKRGGGMPKVSLEEGHDAPAQRPRDVVALDDAMTALARLDPRKAQVVELRYFGGLTGDEIASALGIGTATVTREAALAEAWLRRELTRMPEARG